MVVRYKMLALATVVAAAAVSNQGVQGFTPPSVSVSRSFSVSAASPALGHGRRTPTATATGQGQHFHSYSYYNSNGLSGRQAPASSSSSSSSSSSACYSYASMTSTSLHAFRKEEQQILETTTALHGGDPTNGTNDNAALMEHNNNNNDILEPDHIYESAIQRTIYWVAAAGVFGAGLFAVFGSQTGEEFFAGYLLEQSLSIDNLLVFLLLFEYFKIPLQCQDRVLNWGIIGAIVMRATMIGAGAVALAQFHAVLLGFAAILIYSSAKVLLGGDGDDNDEQDLSQNQIVQFSNRMIASTDQFDGDRFFTVIDGVRKATPLLICMVAVEISDVVFAVDSIPAVFGVTENPLVVFSSNMFAIMGLRSLYTILSKAASELKYLEPAVAIVLGFIGVKMVAEFFGVLVPTELSLGVVLTLLGGGVALSVYDKDKEEIIMAAAQAVVVDPATADLAVLEEEPQELEEQQQTTSTSTMEETADVVVEQDQTTSGSSMEDTVVVVEQDQTTTTTTTTTTGSSSGGGEN